MFDICEVPRLGKLGTNTTSWGVFAMGPRIPGQGRLQKPGGKHTPELAEGEGTPSQVENTINNTIDSHARIAYKGSDYLSANLNVCVNGKWFSSDNLIY